MRLLRCWLWGLVFCMASACTPQSLPEIEGVNIVGAEYDRGSEWPSHVVIALDIDNPTYAAKLCEGQIRISYKGRNVVILSLDKRVKIAARSRQRVELPLKVSVARNSLTAAFKGAMQRGDASDARVEWRIKVRVAGLKRYEIVQTAEPVEDIFSSEQLDELWRQLGIAEAER